MSKRRKAAEHTSSRKPHELLDLNLSVFQNVLPYVSFDEISKLRLICRPVDAICQKSLNNGFSKLKLEVSATYKYWRMSSEISVRKFHDLKILKNALEDLDFNIGHYISEQQCCFFPGKILDVMLLGWKKIRAGEQLPSIFEINGEFDVLIENAKTHLKNEIIPRIKMKNMNRFIETQFDPRPVNITSVDKKPSAIKIANTNRMNPVTEKFDRLKETPGTSSTIQNTNREADDDDENPNLEVVNFIHNKITVADETDYLIEGVEICQINDNEESVKIQEQEKKLMELELRIREQCKVIEDQNLQIIEMEKINKNKTTSIEEYESKYKAEQKKSQDLLDKNHNMEAKVKDLEQRLKEQNTSRSLNAIIETSEEPALRRSSRIKSKQTESTNKVQGKENFKVKPTKKGKK